MSAAVEVTIQCNNVSCLAIRKFPVPTVTEARVAADEAGWGTRGLAVKQKLAPGGTVSVIADYCPKCWGGMK